MNKKRQKNWNDVYYHNDIEAMPWFYSNLDPDFERALIAVEGPRKRILDIGTGPGTQAIELAKRGFSVVATDISEEAITEARIRAREENVEVDFRQDDILSTHLDFSFDYIFDRGLFHLFDSRERIKYESTACSLLRPGGFLLLKCFSHLQVGDDGPHKFSPNDLQKLFEELFTVISIEDTIFYGTQPSVKALFGIFQRKVH